MSKLSMTKLNTLLKAGRTVLAVFSTILERFLKALDRVSTILSIPPFFRVLYTPSIADLKGYCILLGRNAIMAYTIFVAI